MVFTGLCLLAGGLPVRAQVVDLSPDQNAAVIHTHYLQWLNYRLTQPWLYAPVQPAQVKPVSVDDLIDIQSAEVDLPSPLPADQPPIIHITAKAP